MAEQSEMRARLARLASELETERSMIRALGADISSKSAPLTADPDNKMNGDIVGPTKELARWEALE
jgi:hypothetical protein